LCAKGYTTNIRTRPYSRLDSFQFNLLTAIPGPNPKKDIDTIIGDDLVQDGQGSCIVHKSSEIPLGHASDPH
jgi:hypothetical protein